MRRRLLIPTLKLVAALFLLTAGLGVGGVEGQSTTDSATLTVSTEGPEGPVDGADWLTRGSKDLFSSLSY